MIGVGRSDIGRIRLRNEDSIMVSNEPLGPLDNIYIVADGMGGHKAGNVASSTAIAAFCDYIRGASPQDEVLDVLIGGVNEANSTVYSMSRQDEALSNMGSTFIACSIKDGTAYIAHVGDSRLYRLSDGVLTQVTNDHSFVAEMVKMGLITPEEAKVHPQRNTITRAVGTDSFVTSDGILLPLKEGDSILMCSDGLSGMVSNEAIQGVLSEDKITIEQKADTLVELANCNGGSDNISVIVIEY
jgi:protein phosphatase